MTSGQRCVERTKIRSQNLGAVEHRIKILADDSFAPGPLAQPAVSPNDRIVAVEQNYPVGHSFEDVDVVRDVELAVRMLLGRVLGWVAFLLGLLAELARLVQLLDVGVRPGLAHSLPSSGSYFRS